MYPVAQKNTLFVAYIKYDWYTDKYNALTVEISGRALSLSMGFVGENLNRKPMGFDHQIGQKGFPVNIFPIIQVYDSLCLACWYYKILLQ